MAKQEQKKPNILVIWGDDIGITNLSCYSDGMMGYRTPNIDRIAKESAMFTDWYGQQSCTAGRAALHHGTVSDPYRPNQGRPPGSEARPPGGRPDDRGPAETLGLCHWPVRSRVLCRGGGRLA